MHLSITTEDGWRLASELHPSLGTPVARTVCIHAMMCNRRTLDKPRGAGLATALAKAGVEAHLVDLRGHGQSSGGDPARVTYDDIVLRDIPAIVRAAAALSPALPVVLVGHSLGAHAGLAALGAAPDLPVAGVVSLGGNIWMRRTEADLARRAIKRAVMELWGAVALAAGRFPTRALRLGTDDEALPYVGQLVGFARTGRWVGRDGRDWDAGLSSVTCRVLSVTSRDDRWMCHPASAAEWLRAVPHVEHRVVGERSDDPRGVGHMGLAIDPHMAAVHEEIGAWVRSLVA